MRSDHWHQLPIKTAIVVDDDPIFQQLATQHLQRQGIHVYGAAGNASDAIRLFQGTPSSADLILTDLRMPGGDGLSFFRKLEESGCRASIIVVSGEDDAIFSLATTLARSHGLNLLGCVRKPMTASTLREVLARGQTSKASRQADPAIDIGADELRGAIGNGEVKPHFQPKVLVATGQLLGAEALARWEHPTRGLIAPSHFIPLAEASGLIAEMTSAIMSAALRETTRMRRQLPDFKIAVNASTAVLNDLRFIDEVETNLRTWCLPADALTIEVTESQVLSPGAAQLEVLGRLRLMGVGLSIDDFGTGYSNLESLRNFPFTELKIDRSFLLNAHVDRRADASIKSCILLGRELNLNMVAEGVETTLDWDYIHDLGIAEAQGFLIAKPMPIDPMLDWMRARDRCLAALN